MARDDGGLGPDLLSDIFVKGIADAARTGARAAVGPDGDMAAAVDRFEHRVQDATVGRVRRTKHARHQSRSQSAEDRRRSYDDFVVNAEAIARAGEMAQSLLDVVEASANQLAAIITDPASARSALISPLTAGPVATAVATAHVTFTTLVTLIRPLVPVWQTVMMTCQGVDSELSLRARDLGRNIGIAWDASLGATSDSFRALFGLLELPDSALRSVGGAVEYATGWQVAVGQAVGQTVDGIGHGLRGIAREALTDIGVLLTHRVLSDPKALDDPADWLRAASDSVADIDWSERLSLAEIERAAGDYMPDSGSGSHGSIMANLAAAWALSGRSALGTKVYHPNPTQRQQIEEARRSFRARLGHTHPQLTGDYRRARDVSDLFLNAGEIDAMGKNKVSVIRVLVNHGPPKSFTLILPSTQDWYSTSKVPNDLASNIVVMAGADSALLRAGERALRSTLKAHGVNPATAQVMVAGFSQGGITAARFAQRHHKDLGVRHVVTGGSPVGRIPIPDGVTIESYENPDDKVVRMDLKRNRPKGSHTTIYGRARGPKAAD